MSRFIRAEVAGIIGGALFDDLLLLLSRFSCVRHVRPHRQQPTRFPCPWDSPGKNTGVGCHFLLQFDDQLIEKF